MFICFIWSAIARNTLGVLAVANTFPYSLKFPFKSFQPNVDGVSRTYYIYMLLLYRDYIYWFGNFGFWYKNRITINSNFYFVARSAMMVLIRDSPDSNPRFYDLMFAGKGYSRRSLGLWWSMMSAIREDFVCQIIQTNLEWRT